MAVRYYLKIDGIAGGSNSEGHAGAFDVNDYSFDVSAIASAMRGMGSGAGRTDFSPLIVDLDGNTGLVSLLNQLASGEHIRSMELQGVSDDGETVYTLRLGDVTVTKLQDSATGRNIASFDYGQVSVTTTEQDERGGRGHEETFSWNVAANEQDVDIPEPDVPTGGPIAGEAQSYYLTIDGIAGASTREGHEGAFEVNDYSFDISAIVNAMRTGGGSGSGRTEFSPLIVDLDANPGLTSLLNHVATGRHITSLELQGVSADGETVYDLRLGDVTVTRIHDGNTGHDMVSFSYNQVSVTTTGQKEDGSLGQSETFSWDVARGESDVTIPEPSVPTDSPSGEAQSFYLTIDGIAGGSTSEGHEGAFDVNGYSFDATAIVSAMRNGGGSGSGRTEFSPLTVDLDADSGMAALLKHVANGQHIRSLELEGVTGDGNTVYDLRLGDVTVTYFQDSSTGHDMVSFSYRQVSLTTTEQKQDGSLGQNETFSWDVARNESGVTILEPRVPTDGHTVAEPQSYYLTIDGIAGDSVRKGHEGAFEVNDYSFDVSAIVSAVRTGGGAGSGRTEFSPLTVDLDANSGMASLLQHLASGQHIRSLELQGVTGDGDTVYDLMLGDVTVTRFQDSSTGHDMVTFEYRQVSVTTTGESENGKAGPQETFSWDVARNQSGVTIPEPRVPTDGHAVAEAQSYYLTIDGIAGGSTSEGHEGSFDVNGYSFDVSAIVSAMRTGGGSGSGRTEFSPLTVDLDANSGLTSLLQHLASGQHIRSLELQGVTGDGGTVYDLRLGDVTVTHFRDSSTGHDMVSFDYRQVSITTTGQSEDGRAGPQETFSWDVAQGHSGVTIPEPRVPTDGHPVAEVQNFYLTIDGIAGDSIVEGHEGAFDVNDYSFDVSAIVNAMRVGAGGGSGRTEFSPLTIDLDVNTGLTSLLNHVATGRDIPSLELQGVSADGETVYDLLLGDVTVTHFTDSSTGHDMLSFSYGQVSITTTGQSEDGRAGPRETFSWDVAEGHSGVTIPEPHVPTDGDQLLNGNKADVVHGSPGGILTGPHPGHDQFVFTGDFGHNEITNFSRSDHIVLERSHFGNANEILEHYASDDGHGNTVITDPHNPDNVIVLDHVSVEELDVTDFVLL
jgi:type VI protein secretion system component Hcp